MTARRARRPRATWLRYVLGLAAIGAVVVFFVREHRLFAGFGAAVAHLTWYWVLAAFAAELASLPPLAEAQRMVLRAGGVRSGRLQMNLVTLASNAISASVPAGLAVAEGYSFGRYRRFGAGSAVAAWSELAAGAIAFCALAALALAGAVIAGGGAETILLPVLAVVFAGSAAAAILFRYPSLLARGPQWIQAYAGPPGRVLGRVLGRLARGFSQAAYPLTRVRPSIGLWTAAWGLSALNWLLDAAGLALSFAAVHAAIPWGVVLLAFAAAKVASSIGITPSGLGVVEGGLIATFIAYGVAGASAGAAVLVYRAVTVIGLAGLGWLSVALLAIGDHRHARRSRAPWLPAGQPREGQHARPG